MGNSDRAWKWAGAPALWLLLVANARAQQVNDGLFGDIGGLRKVLDRYGIAFNATDSENLLGNVAGGVKTGATMQGVTTLGIDADLGKLIGLPGASFHASALQIHGQPLSPHYLQSLQAANGNEAEDTTRLWELWYDQAFFGSRMDVKLGQQSIDNEFQVSTYSGLFVNTMAGWPLIPSEDLYGGGPAYPLSSLGVRVQAHLNDKVTMLAGVFDDNPGGGGFNDDAQRLDHNGALFNLNTGALWIAELQFAAKLGGLPGSYKLGGWFDSGAFPDQRFDSEGRSLAASESSGDPLMHHGGYSLYAVADQTVWQSRRDDARTLNLFARLMGAPSAQNLVTLSFNGGMTLKAPFRGRENDSAGIDLGIGKVGSRAADLDGDAGLRRRGVETLVEITYQAQATPWLVLQPDLQFVANPGGGVADPDRPGHALRNELVVGARAVVTF